NHETKISRLDARIVQTVRNRFRWTSAANAVSFEARQPLLLNRNHDLVALQQTRGTVMRGTDPKNPWLFVQFGPFGKIIQLGGVSTDAGKPFLLLSSSSHTASPAPVRRRCRRDKCECRQIRGDRSCGR